jgi:hypothetical protein
MIMMHDVDIAVSTALRSILHVSHLYNAVQQMSILKVDWPVLDILIFLNTPETLCARGLPTTLEDCIKKH